MVDVRKSRYVVFVEVGSRLHLYQESWNFSGVREAMPLPDGDVSGLILGQQAPCIALGDLKSALHNHPMFRSVVVALERERATWFHHDAFDLIAVTTI